MPDSEPAELASYFQSRDSDTIISGLNTLLATQTRRLNKGLEMEEENGKLDPEVTKIVNSLFDRGRKLALLVDPTLAAAQKPNVNISLNQQNNTINASSPQELMAAIVQQLEAKGVPRNQITPDMVKNLLGMGEQDRQQAIEAVTVK